MSFAEFCASLNKLARHKYTAAASRVCEDVHEVLTLETHRGMHRSNSCLGASGAPDEEEESDSSTNRGSLALSIDEEPQPEPLLVEAEPEFHLIAPITFGTGLADYMGQLREQHVPHGLSSLPRSRSR